MKPEPNDEQRIALQWLDAGYNVFLSGVAGTGKTFTLNYWLNSLPPEKIVGVTASTGIAATHLNGMTLHRWIAAHAEHDTPDRLCTDKWLERHGDRIRAADVLVLDEVSMVDGRMFTLAEAAHRHASDNNSPWGGTQIVLVGDMGQLPPVQADENGWCFQSPAWRPSDIKVIELRTVVRQADHDFAELLREVRSGAAGNRVLYTLVERVKAYDPNERECVRLMTHNAQADRVNAERLAKITGKARSYYSTDGGSNPHLRALKKSCLSPACLKLKVGARVMFTRNDKGGAWVNGTTGVVVEMFEGEIVVAIDGDMDRQVSVTRTKWESKQWNKMGTLEVKASRSQYPLRLAWAITIHKSQGMTIENVSVNLAHCFAPGQAYVALSRCRSLEGLNIEDWRGLSSFTVHPMIAAQPRRT